MPRRVFKSSAKDSAHRPGGIKLRGSRPRLIPLRGLGRYHGPIGAYAPTLGREGRRALAPVASLDSDLEAFSHNPAHGSFAPLAFQPKRDDQLCESNGSSRTRLNYYRGTVIRRADIEGSKSNVAMNAWLPQASYPCGNFSDTSSFKLRRSKGSIGHAFTVRIRTGNQNQTSFYPFVPHEISVLVELILGHLRYLLTDVPPQPNSPPDNVFRPDRQARSRLGSKRGEAPPPPLHGISKITLKVVVFHLRRQAGSHLSYSLSSHFTNRIPLVRTSSESAVRPPGEGPRGSRSRPVPRPARGDPLSPRSSSSSPPAADGFGGRDPPGCSPWRPDAVMSTTGRGRHSVLRIFKGRRGRTGHRATCGALPAAGPYLRLSRFQGGQAVKQKR
ncbi:hypothetical protein LUZ60_017911 [Juncus effusus]|nr:hypothetical protein LUZ60_017911 [Juncus effusus]